MKTLRESILTSEDPDIGIAVNLAMDDMDLWHFEKSKCKYEMRGHTMYIKSWRSAPRPNNKFIASMTRLNVNKIVWDVTGCTPRLYGDWDIDIDILNGGIVICCDTMSCKMNCDETIDLQESTIFKNTQIYCEKLNVNYGNQPEFKGNSKIYVPSISVHGDYMTDYKKIRENLFLNELEKFGVISISKSGQISTKFTTGTGTDLTINKLCGKIFPDVKDISMTQIHGTGLYIGKNFKYSDWGYDWKELKLKDGNSLWVGNQK